jgi:N-terminal domain of anti-restriction factor ArdC
MTTKTKAYTPLSAEEKAARLDEAHNAIAAQVAEIRSSEDWVRVLDFSAQFHSYSFGNVLFLLRQAAIRNMEVTRFAGFGVWKKAGRNVIKGSTGFKVLAPVIVPDDVKRANGDPKATKLVGWKMATVFDVSQTDGEPLPTVDHGTVATSVPEGLLVTLAGIAAGTGYPWAYGDSGTADGHTDPVRKSIVISSRFAGNEPQTVAILLHEIAHVMLGHLAEDYAYTEHRGEAEVEAESVAYVAGRVLGMDMGTSSFSYVAHWGDADKVMAAGQRVQRAAKALIAQIEGT